MKGENWRESLIALLAIISIILIVIDSLITLSPRWLFGIYIVDLLICLVFAWEFAYRLRHAEDKLSFLKTHGFEILAMIPAFALYLAGSSTAISAGLRSLRLIRVIRVVFAIARMRRFFRVSGRFVQRSGLIYLLIASFSVILIGGFAALIMESGTSGAQINNFSDALWWSISTVTTVGYGDIVPNSIAGRIMGMALMVIGIGVMTAFISQVSATLVQSRLAKTHDAEGIRQTLASQIKDRIDHIDKLSDSEMALLTKMIQALHETQGN